MRRTNLTHKHLTSRGLALCNLASLLSVILASSTAAWAWSGALSGTGRVDADETSLIGSGTYEASRRLSFIASCRLPGARRGVLQLTLDDHVTDGDPVTLPAQGLHYSEFNASGQSLINGHASTGSVSVTSTRSGAVIELRISAEVTSELTRRALSNLEIKLINRDAAPDERDPYDSIIAQPELDDEPDDWFGCDETSGSYEDGYSGYDVDLDYEDYYEDATADPESSYQSESLWGGDDAAWLSDDSDLGEYDDSESESSGCDSEDDAWESDEFEVEAAPRPTRSARLRSPRFWRLVSRLIPVLSSLLLIRIWRRFSAKRLNTSS